MATLAEAQTEVTNEYPGATFAAAEDHPRFGSAVQVVRWFATDVDDPVSGTIYVIGSDAFVEVPAPLATYRDGLISWITDYDNRPWGMVLRICSLDREYKVAVILAATVTSGTEATVDYHVVAYLNATWLSRKVSNITPILSR